MTRYQSMPSVTGTPPIEWPRDTEFPDPFGPNGRPVLLVFVHPKCPCTRASIAELARLMNQCDGRVDTMVVLVKPPGVDDDWTQTDLREQALRIPSVTVCVDEDGCLASRFQAITSGETLLYSRSGWLQFHGGITASRGHQGQNPGRSFITSLLLSATEPNRMDVQRFQSQNNSSPPVVAETAVYGCALLNAPSDNQGY